MNMYRKTAHLHNFSYLFLIKPVVVEGIYSYHFRVFV